MERRALNGRLEGNWRRERTWCYNKNYYTYNPCSRELEDCHDSSQPGLNSGFPGSLGCTMRARPRGQETEEQREGGTITNGADMGGSSASTEWSLKGTIWDSRVSNGKEVTLEEKRSPCSKSSESNH